jgi:tRNA threonylcarbamoyladenosine biosynthesis protein TsaE
VASTTSAKPSDTFVYAKHLASGIQPGSVIGLCGDLGSGKTHFVKGLADGLGYMGDVTSPTFTVIHEYMGGLLPLYHFDLYRIDSAEEVLQLDLEEYLESDGVCVIEWADKFPNLLPPHTRWFHIAISGESRRVISERE